MTGTRGPQIRECADVDCTNPGVPWPGSPWFLCGWHALNGANVPDTPPHRVWPPRTRRARRIVGYALIAAVLIGFNVWHDGLLLALFTLGLTVVVAAAVLSVLVWIDRGDR